MATLVFTAVGQALGGPMGAALGSIIGRSVDDSLFGSGLRRGPRLGDLSVQTSTYGSMIPRVYGTMRVAGTVIWSTDLIEEETVEGGGKGAAPTQGYKYSVSLAVALSSRPVKSAGRIWADGKLIRGAEGDFKVRTEFRLLDGGEDQAIDPLIAAKEGIDLTPAYRGVALALFEGLELREFGNRIPQFTFEISADDGAVSLAAITKDCSRGLVIGADGEDVVGGYAAYGQTRRAALAALVDVAAIDLTDDGERLRVVTDDEPVMIGSAELGCSSDDTAQQFELHRDAAGTTAAMAVTFYDVARDYQAGQARVSSGGGGVRDERVELPAAMDAELAKAYAERLLVTNNSGSDTMTVRLSPKHMSLVPGRLLTLPGQGTWQARAVAVKEMAVLVELRRPSTGRLPMPADSGQIAVQPDVAIGRTELAIIETPNLPGLSGPFIAGSNKGLWKSVPVELAVNGVVSGALGLPRAARLGRTITVLSVAPSGLIDRQSALIVEMIDPGQLLFNADEDALNTGVNAAMVGNEIIQFGGAEALGDGRWRLTRLLRGCRGTEWASGAHEVGEAFCLLGPGLQSVSLAGLVEGCEMRAVANGIADRSPLPSATRTFQAEYLKPPSPCRLAARLEGAAVQLNWEGRSWSTFDWADGSEATGTTYVVRFETLTGALQVQTSEKTVTLPMSEIPGSGPRAVTVKVAASTDTRLSRPATVNFEI